MLGLNTPVGNAAAGDFGLGALPGRESEFQQAADQAISTAMPSGIGGPPLLNSCGGGCGSCRRTHLRREPESGGRQGRQAGMTVLLEPINHRDRPGYFLHSIEQAASIIGQVGRRNVRSCSTAITRRSCRAT